MAILYSVISRKNIILARYAGCIGNFAEITDLVLGRIDTDARSKMTYQSGHYLYHYISEAGVIFLCITDDDFDRASAFAFLETLKDRFVSQYGSRANTAVPFAMNTEFSPVMAAEMKKSNHAAVDAIGTASASSSIGDDAKVERLKGEVQQVKEIMVANIEQIVERGERLDLLVDRSENLSNESVTFKRTSTALQRKMWWQNAKMKVIMAVVVIVIIYGIVSASCGGLLWPKCV